MNKPLPPLPRYKNLANPYAPSSTVYGYSKEQMQEYALAARKELEDELSGTDGWIANAEYLLNNCPYTIRMREGGGPENVLSSLVVTFLGMQHRVKEYDAYVQRRLKEFDNGGLPTR